LASDLIVGNSRIVAFRLLTIDCLYPMAMSIDRLVGLHASGKKELL
jgi:hypothetical protein